jgi:4-amino-4-deoxy-L-arabinose transferase-like glycosyltransferase
VSWSALAVAVVLAVTIALRLRTTSDLWLDEALSVNIARLPLSQLHQALRHDGAPPLYYALLHFWIRAFGTGNVAVRSLSGLISLATLPAAWFAGRRLGRRRVAWLAVLVVAASPYAVEYATSARMYALVMLLVFVGYLVTLRALEEPTVGRLALVALLTAGLVYTQYWCFYLLGVVGVLLVVRAWRAGPGQTRRDATQVIGAVVVGGFTFIPWVPTFIYQARHTGTPWGDARVPWSAIAEAVLHFAGSDQNGETFILLFALLTLLVFGVFGRGRDGHTIELDLRTQPATRREALLAAGTLGLGTSASFVLGSAFDARYASVMFPFFALLAAVGISLFLDARVRAGVLAVVVGIGIIGGVRNYTTNRTQAVQSTNIIAAESRPGDVVAYCPDQIGPSASRLLRTVPGLVQLTFPDGAGPQRVNWVDYIDRIQAASPKAFANRVLARAGTHTVWFVYAYGYDHIEGKCEAMNAQLAQVRPHNTERVIPDVSIDEYMGLTVYNP